MKPLSTLINLIATTKLTALLVVSSLLLGCGFQLKSSINLPSGVEPFYISGPGNIKTDIRNYFAIYNIKTTNDKALASHTFEVINYSNKQQEASLGDGSKVLEYLLLQTVSFQIRNKQGQVILGPKSITEQRILKNDPRAVGSTGQERQLLIKEMKQSIISRATTQLRAFNFATPKQQTDNET